MVEALNQVAARRRRRLRVADGAGTYEPSPPNQARRDTAKS
jgi:hypothetical protein